MAPAFPSRSCCNRRPSLPTPSLKPIRILVVDDHFMVRMGLSASLNVEPDMEVIAEAGTGEAALEACRKHQPNFVMMDVGLPGMGGPDETARIRRQFRECWVFSFSTPRG